MDEETENDPEDPPASIGREQWVELAVRVDAQRIALRFLIERIGGRTMIEELLTRLDASEAQAQADGAEERILLTLAYMRDEWHRLGTPLPEPDDEA